MEWLVPWKDSNSSTACRPFPDMREVVEQQMDEVNGR